MVAEGAGRPRRPLRALLGVLLLAATPLGAQELGAGLEPAAGTPPAPALALDGLDGKRHDLARLRGKVVLVNFWATWCPPCREEMPAIERLHRTLRARGLRVLAVDAGEPASAVRAFLAELEGGLGFPVLLDPRMEAFARWPVRGLPTSFVVDRRGRIRYIAVGARRFDSAPIRALLLGLLEEDR